MSGRSRLAWLGLLILAGITVSPAMGAPAESAAYRGQLSGYRDALVKFRVETTKDGRTAVFRARNVELACDDGTFPTRSFPRVRVSFLNQRVFQAQRYRGSPEAHWSYYEFKGRLLSGGRASGYLYYWENHFDDAHPDCGLGSQLYSFWRARKTK